MRCFKCDLEFKSKLVADRQHEGVIIYTCQNKKCENFGEEFLLSELEEIEEDGKI